MISYHFTVWIVQSNKLLWFGWTNPVAHYILADAWRQIWREDLLWSFIEMATSRFVNVSNEDISEFLKENENKNTTRTTSQDVACDM